MAWCSGGVWGQTVLAYQPRQWCDCIYPVSLSFSFNDLLDTNRICIWLRQISGRTFEGLSGMLDGWGDQRYIRRQLGKWAADARYCGCGKPDAKGWIVAPNGGSMGESSSTMQMQEVENIPLVASSALPGVLAPGRHVSPSSSSPLPFPPLLHPPFVIDPLLPLRRIERRQ